MVSCSSHDASAAAAHWGLIYQLVMLVIGFIIAGFELNLALYMAMQTEV